MAGDVTFTTRKCKQILLKCWLVMYNNLWMTVLYHCITTLVCQVLRRCIASWIVCLFSSLVTGQLISEMTRVKCTGRRNTWQGFHFLILGSSLALLCITVYTALPDGCRAVCVWSLEWAWSEHISNAWPKSHTSPVVRISVLQMFQGCNWACVVTLVFRLVVWCLSALLSTTYVHPLRTCVFRVTICVKSKCCLIFSKLL